MMWRSEPEPSKYGNRMIPAIKQLVVFTVGWIGFQALAFTIQLIMGAFATAQGQDVEQFLSTNSASIIVNSASYLALLISIIGIINFDITKLFKSFKQWQSYLAGLVCLLAIFAFDYLWGFILELLPISSGDNINDSSLQTMMGAYPIASLIIFGIIGPVCEEFTYRVGLFSFFKRINKWVAYVVTVIIFAFIHFNFSTDASTLLNEVLNLPFYMFAAFAFSFTYDKFGLAGSLSAHIVNNLMSLSLSLISVTH